MRNSRRILPLLLLVVLLAVAALGQHQAQGTQHQAEPAAAPHQPAQHGAQAGESGSQGEFGKELAEASREAEGQEEENAEFKQSPSVLYVARLTGLSPHVAYWVFIIINFAIIAALIILASKSKVPAMFRARTEAIRKGIEEARQASEDANRRLSEIQSRLERLDVEISEMRKLAEAEAAKEEQRIQASIEEERRKIIESAEQEIAFAARFARRDLKAYAAELAVTLAEKKIHVDAATDQALVSSFVDQLGKDGR